MRSVPLQPEFVAERHVRPTDVNGEVISKMFAKIGATAFRCAKRRVRKLAHFEN